MNTIRSQNHQLGSYEINKVSLSCFDDKRYILENGIKSYAYGHYLIKNPHHHSCGMTSHKNAESESESKDSQ